MGSHYWDCAVLRESCAAHKLVKHRLHDMAYVVTPVGGYCEYDTYTVVKDSVVLAYTYVAASSACQSDLREHGMITLCTTMICCVRVVTQPGALTKSVPP